MAKPDLGTKRLCGNCGAKFYDLGKSNIVCPKCSTVFEVVAVTARAPRPDAAAAARAAAAAAAAKAAIVVVPETADAEFVSLEDADAEAEGKKVAAVDGVEPDEDVEIEDDVADDAPFIEEQEDGDEDVTDIIGEREDEEET